MKVLSVTEAVRYILAEENMNSYRLAKILDCTPGHINHIKKGKVKSSNSKLAMAIYKHFDILLDTFNTPEQLKAIYEHDYKDKR